MQVHEIEGSAAQRHELDVDFDRAGIDVPAASANGLAADGADRQAGEPLHDLGVVHGHEGVLGIALHQSPQNAGAVAGRAASNVVRRFNQQHRALRRGSDAIEHFVHGRVHHRPGFTEVPRQLCALFQLLARSGAAGLRHDAERHSGFGRVGEGKAGRDIVRPDGRRAAFMRRGKGSQGLHRVGVGARTGRGPHHGHATPTGFRNDPGAQAAVEQRRGAQRRLLRIRVRILAINDEAVRLGAHAGRHIAMQIEHGKERQAGRSRQSTETSQKFAFDVVDRAGRHRAVQDKKNGIDARGQRRFGPLGKLRPITFKHLILHRSARHRPCVDRRHDLPAIAARLLEETRGRRLVAFLGQNLISPGDGEIGPDGRIREKRVGLVKKDSEEDARLHGRSGTFPVQAGRTQVAA